MQIHGTVQREKLGDTINICDLSVRCFDFRFPDAVIGRSVTAEGKLEIVHDQPATTNEQGGFRKVPKTVEHHWSFVTA